MNEGMESTVGSPGLMEFALTLCQIQVTISKSAQEKMRSKQMKEVDVFQGAKGPERQRELTPQSLGARRSWVKEGTGSLGQDSLGLGRLLGQHLGQKRGCHSPPLGVGREPHLLP